MYSECSQIILGHLQYFMWMGWMDGTGWTVIIGQRHSNNANNKMIIIKRKQQFRIIQCNNNNNNNMYSSYSALDLSENYQNKMEDCYSSHQDIEVGNECLDSR